MVYCIKQDSEYLKGNFDTFEDAEFYMHDNFNSTVCTVEKENRFYGFDFNDGQVSFIGEFDEFSEADDALAELNRDCGWIFDDQNLSEFINSATIALSCKVGVVEEANNKLRGLSEKS